jgi:carboxypeptidase family protein
MDACQCQVKYRQSSGSFNISPTQTEITNHATCERAGRERILSGRRRRVVPAALCLLVAVTLFSGRAMASVTASISGTVKDQSGSVISGATVTASNVETGIPRSTRTNEAGFYSFQSLPLGHYEVDVQHSGFTPFHETGVVLDVNSALVVDVVMQVGNDKQTVSVTSTELHVDTASTQMGEVITGQAITSVPLVSRSYTDLLALQPGVGTTSSGMSGSGNGTSNTGSNFLSGGFDETPVSGSLDAGSLSVNGMRESENGFLLNGAIVVDVGFGGAAVIPDLDSIAEFRIITNNFDAEYGNYSGGQINVITKSGTNELHGNLFEFLRNTDVDGRAYFDPTRASYNQNQFGGTVGGPIKRDKVFFFADYQGNRVVQGISSGLVPVPSSAERGGDFSQVFTSTGQNEMSGTVDGANWASQLSSELGYPVTNGEAYYTPGCTSASCVFPGAQIPQGSFSTVAKNILKYIPSPNDGAFYTTSSYPERLRDDKTSGRIDADSRFGLLSGYYFFDNYSLLDPYTPSSTVPGFGSLAPGTTQAINLGDTKPIGSASVNEVRIEYERSKNSVKANGGTGAATVGDLGFTGFTPLDEADQGVPGLQFNSFDAGVLSRPVGLTENIYEVLDNFSKVFGKHTVSVGGNYHYGELQEILDNIEDGAFQFYGTETGIDFADFLLGAPTDFIQGQAFPSNGRSQYLGLYAQDSWRFNSQLTLNYGLRWEFNTPWWEQHNQLEAIVPGEQSVEYPNSPAGWVFPGDPGVPRTLAPTHYNNFSPRFGLAYSPHVANGFLSKLFGAGQSSIRAGYGLFFTSFEGASTFDEIGDAPFGDFAVVSNPEFSTPYENRSNGGPPAVDPFPVKYPVPHDINFAAAGFLPISSSPGLSPSDRLPYAEEYEFSIERQFASSTLLTVSYVGTEAHRLFSSMEANPGSVSICEYLNANGATPTCGPNGESTTYTLPLGVAAPPGAASITSGNQVFGTRTALGANFGSEAYFITNGQSSYNSLQVSLRHSAKSFTFLAGYTFSKSLDDASGLGEQVNFENPRLVALSAFNQPQNFVLSYSYNLPFDMLGGPKRLTNGWQLSGITRFASGQPVDLYELDDNSLLGTIDSGPMPIGIDSPLFLGKSIQRTNARKTGNYFNPSQFEPEPIGTLGSSRFFFSGPGSNDWDMALLKDTKLNERTMLEFRAEFFNLFNHTQFSSVNGNIDNSTFGSVLAAQQPRIGQFSLKLNF